MLNPDGTTHPATFQPDLCDSLTPATVVVWLRRQGIALRVDGNETGAARLAMAAQTVETLLVDAKSRPHPFQHYIATGAAMSPEREEQG